MDDKKPKVLSIKWNSCIYNILLGCKEIDVNKRRDTSTLKGIKISKIKKVLLDKSLESHS